MTKKENFGALRYIVENFVNDEIFADGGTFASIDKNGLLSFIDHEIELLNRKRTGATKPTKRQVENEALKGEILNVLARADEGGMTVGEIAKVVDFEGATPNRVNALVAQLKKAEQVVRTEVKGKAMFTIA